MINVPTGAVMFVSRAARTALAALLVFTPTLRSQEARRDSIPLPEHPRPDLRAARVAEPEWTWDFAFDKSDEGERAGWSAAASVSPTDPRAVLLGCAGVRRPDSAEIGWYSRPITIPERWRGRRVYLVVGASDWRTSVWLDGTKVGEHQGGYVPFSVELTGAHGTARRSAWRYASTTARTRSSSRESRGTGRRAACGRPSIWRPRRRPLASVHFTPDLAAAWRSWTRDWPSPRRAI
jgi:hypothetical protein